MSEPLRVGIAGPVGAGKTTLVELLCRKLSPNFEVAVVTNDIYTQEDAEILWRSQVLSEARIVGVETGGCPHTAIREDASMNLAAIDRLIETFPELDIIIVESGGDNLSATFSPELVDLTIYIIDVAGGEKIPRKGGPGITLSDLLIINKTDLAPHVGASLEVMKKDTERMRDSAPFVFTNLKLGEGVNSVVDFVRKEGLWEGSIAHHLVASLPTNTLLRIASSMPIRDVDSFAVDDGKCLTVSSNRGVNGIDGTIATTFGEATVHQGPVATLMGDLSFIHDASALLTTPHPTQPTVITVVNNGGGGIFGFLPMRKHSTGFEPWYVTPHKHDIRAICEAAQVAVYEPNNLADYMESISSALQTNGVTVVHVKIDRKASTDKHFQAWSDVCSAVEAAQ